MVNVVMVGTKAGWKDRGSNQNGTD